VQGLLRPNVFFEISGVIDSSLALMTGGRNRAEKDCPHEGTGSAMAEYLASTGYEEQATP